MEKYIIYSITYLTLCNWLQIFYLYKNILKPVKKITTYTNEKLLNKIQHKTNLNLIIKIIEENKCIGFMTTSPPFPPLIILSTKLIEQLNDSELEWVLLHESAHYKMRHNYKFIFIQLIIFFLGILIVNNIFIVLIPIIAVILAIIYIQIVKIFEYQADNFAAQKITDPKAMISGNVKMRKGNENFFINKYFKNLLIIAVPNEDRIKIAEKEIQRRKLLI